jgi:hypothetical protein
MECPQTIMKLLTKEHIVIQVLWEPISINLTPKLKKKEKFIDSKTTLNQRRDNPKSKTKLKLTLNLIRRTLLSR